MKCFGVDTKKAASTTFAAVDSMLAKVRAKDPKSDPVIVIGQQDGYRVVTSLGHDQGRLHAGAEVRDGISTSRGDVRQSHEQAVRWTSDEVVKAAGYIGKTTTPSTRRRLPRLRQGQGAVFYLGVNWQAQV